MVRFIFTFSLMIITQCVCASEGFIDPFEVKAEAEAKIQSKVFKAASSKEIQTYVIDTIGANENTLVVWDFDETLSMTGMRVRFSYNHPDPAIGEGEVDEIITHVFSNEFMREDSKEFTADIIGEITKYARDIYLNKHTFCSFEQVPMTEDLRDVIESMKKSGATVIVGSGKPFSHSASILSDTELTFYPEKGHSMQELGLCDTSFSAFRKYFCLKGIKLKSLEKDMPRVMERVKLSEDHKFSKVIHIDNAEGVLAQCCKYDAKDRKKCIGLRENYQYVPIQSTQFRDQLTAGALKDNLIKLEGICELLPHIVVKKQKIDIPYGSNLSDSRGSGHEDDLTGSGGLRVSHDSLRLSLSCSSEEQSYGGLNKSANSISSIK